MLKILLAILLLPSIISCTASTSTASATTNQISHNDVVLDDVSVVPLNKAVAVQEFAVKIHNYKQTASRVEKLAVLNAFDGTNSDGITVNYDDCVQLNSQCQLKFSPHEVGDYIIDVRVVNDDEVHELKKLIRVVNVDRLTKDNGIVMLNDLNKIMLAKNAHYGVAIFFILDEKFDDIKVLNGNLVCDNGFNIGSSCSYLMDGGITTKETMVRTKINAYRSNSREKVASVTQNIRVSAGNEPNILMSYATSLEAGSGLSKIVVIYNNGNAGAGNLNVSLADGRVVKRKSTANDCTNYLAAGASCNVELYANDSVTSGSDILKAEYLFNGNLASSLSNLTYIAPNADFEMSIIHTGDLRNTATNSSTTANVTIQNTGNRELSNLQFSQSIVDGFRLQLDNNDSGNCFQGMDLAEEEECTLPVVYSPTTDNIHGNPAFSIGVKAGHAEEETYGSFVNNYAIAYSAIPSGGIFMLTAGEISLDNHPVWTSAINSDYNPHASYQVMINTTLNTNSITRPATVTLTSDATGATRFQCTINTGDDSCSVLLNIPFSSFTTNQAPSVLITGNLLSGTNTFTQSITVQLPIPLDYRIEVIGASDELTGSGDTEDDPYSFVMVGGEGMALRYSYRNLGNATISNLTLPNVTDGNVSCTGSCSGNHSLAVGGTLAQTFSVPSASLLAITNPAQKVNVQIAMDNLNYLYTSNGITLAAQQVTEKYINVIREWANVSASFLGYNGCVPSTIPCAALIDLQYGGLNHPSSQVQEPIFINYASNLGYPIDGSWPDLGDNFYALVPGGRNVVGIMVTWEALECLYNHEVLFRFYESDFTGDRDEYGDIIVTLP